MQGYPPEMLEEHLHLSEWVTELSYRYGDQIAIRVIDPQSGLGLWKAIQYWVHKYPTFVVNGKEKYTGWDKSALEVLLHNALQKVEDELFPVQVDVVNPIPEGWGICLSCEMLMARANLDKAPHERGLEEYPPEWMEDFERLSAFILELSARYGENVLIRLWDPRSLQGMFKSIRYGVRRYPTFVVNGREKVTGLNAALLEQALRSQGL